MAISDRDTQTRGDTSEPATSDTRNESGLARRGLVAGALAGIVALFVGKAAPAAADDNAPLLIGTRNMATRETDLELVPQPGPAQMPTFSAMQGTSIGMLGGVPVDTSQFKIGTGGRLFNQAAVSGETDGQIGVFGYSGSKGVGVWGASEQFIANWGVSLEGIGVLGQTYPMDIAGHETPYPAAGVFGIGGRAPGTWGLSTSGPGAWGQSNTGPGVLGQTGKADVLPAVQYPMAGVYGVGGDATDVWGVSGRGVGSWGQSNTGIGVSGESGNIGGWFMKKGDVPVDPKSLEPAALHTTAQGVDISMCARAQMGVAVMAETSDPKGTGLMIETPEGGVAIHAMGRFVSSEIMLASVTKGSDMIVIPCGDINPNSHVSIMLRNDVGALVSWVELQPGKGIVVHFDRRTRSDGTLTYAVSEMMGTHQ